jgi:hypothetical protein
MWSRCASQRDACRRCGASTGRLNLVEVACSGRALDTEGKDYVISRQPQQQAGLKLMRSRSRLAGGIGALFVAAAGMPWCLLIVAEITAVMWLLAYCHWWVDDRLICLGGNKLAIGMLISVESPEEKSGFDALDTDYSINLLLPTNVPGAEQATVESSLEIAPEPTGHGLPLGKCEAYNG